MPCFGPLLGKWGEVRICLSSQEGPDKGGSIPAFQLPGRKAKQPQTVKREKIILFHIGYRSCSCHMAPFYENSSFDLNSQFEFRPEIINSPFSSRMEACLTLGPWNAGNLPYRFDIRNEHGFPYILPGGPTFSERRGSSLLFLDHVGLSLGNSNNGHLLYGLFVSFF